MLPSRELFFEVAGGIRLYVADYGPVEGLPVLCLHGLTRNHRDFEGMIGALPNNYRFIVPDMRGRGRSDADSVASRYVLSTYLDDISALVLHFSLDRFAVIGTSMGGIMAMFLAKIFSSRLLGVVLNDIGPKVEATGLARIARDTSLSDDFSDWTEAASFLARSQGSFFPDFVDCDWLRFAHCVCCESGDRVRFDYDPQIVDYFRLEAPDSAADSAMWRLFEHLYLTPLLLVRGSLSDIISLDTASLMLRLHPDSSQVYLSGVGHAPFLDDAVSISAISAFLLRLSMDEVAQA